MRIHNLNLPIPQIYSQHPSYLHSEGKDKGITIYPAGYKITTPVILRSDYLTSYT